MNALEGGVFFDENFLSHQNLVLQEVLGFPFSIIMDLTENF